MEGLTTLSAAQLSYVHEIWCTVKTNGVDKVGAYHGRGGGPHLFVDIVIPHQFDISSIFQTREKLIQMLNLPFGKVPEPFTGLRLSLSCHSLSQGCSRTLNEAEGRVSSAGLKENLLPRVGGTRPRLPRLQAHLGKKFEHSSRLLHKVKVRSNFYFTLHHKLTAKQRSHLTKHEDRRSNPAFANHGLNFFSSQKTLSKGGHNVSQSMATSLDGLIRHLVDQIALCGEHGESIRFFPSPVFELPMPCILQSFLSFFSLVGPYRPLRIPTLFFDNLVLLQNSIGLRMVLQARGSGSTVLSFASIYRND